MLFRAGPVGPRQGVRRLVGAVLLLLCTGLVASKAEGLDLAVGPAGPFSAQALVPTFRAPPMVQDPVTGRNFTFVNEELVAQRPDGTYLDSLPVAQPSGMVLHNGAIFVVRGRAPHLERVDPATLHVTHVMELPELFRSGRMWSIPGGLLSFYEGGVAVTGRGHAGSFGSGIGTNKRSNIGRLMDPWNIPSGRDTWMTHGSVETSAMTTGCRCV